MPLPRFLSLVYVFMTEGGSEDGIAKFDAILWKAPAEEIEVAVTMDPKWDKTAMENDFMATLARRGKP